MKDMTMKEMLVAVSENKVDAEVMAKAKAELEKLEAKAATKSTKAKEKKAEADAPLVEALIAYMMDKEVVLASEVALVLGVSTSKASALLKKLVAEGAAEASDVKVPKAGMRKAYALVA